MGRWAESTGTALEQTVYGEQENKPLPDGIDKFTQILQLIYNSFSSLNKDYLVDLT